MTRRVVHLAGAALLLTALCLLDSVDEAEAGRRGAFLSTSGSFTLSGGSNRAGNDELLGEYSEAVKPRTGEDLGVMPDDTGPEVTDLGQTDPELKGWNKATRRLARAGRGKTCSLLKNSFPLCCNTKAFPATAEGAQQPEGGWDWSLCQSEGGPLDCARCNTTGETGLGAPALRCGAFVPIKRNVGWKGYSYYYRSTGGKFPTCDERPGSEDCPSKCRDARIGAKGQLMFWSPDGLQGVGMCRDLANIANRNPLKSQFSNVWTYYGFKKYGPASPPHFLPGVNGTAQGTNLITKMALAHPHKASTRCGAVMMKRVVVHEHSMKPGVQVADVFKVATCVSCPTPVFSGRVAESLNNTIDYKRFHKCLESAFDNTGGLKSKYECDARDLGHAQSVLAAF